MRNNNCWIVLCGFLAGILILSSATFGHEVAVGEAMPEDDAPKGHDATETDLVPLYPEGFSCSPLTSLYASWVDVDGTERENIHTGVDGGRIGEAIYAPAPGQVVRAWVSDWGWGKEGSLLIRHSREALNLGNDYAPFYYSEFDHLKYKDIKSFEPGQNIQRGQKLGEVWYPGGNKRFLPEVHWEVWEVTDEAETEWRMNDFRQLEWINQTASLIDPLYMLSRQVAPIEAGQVLIEPFVSGRDYTDFSGFTYILPCRRAK